MGYLYDVIGEIMEYYAGPPCPPLPDDINPYTAICDFSKPHKPKLFVGLMEIERTTSGKELIGMIYGYQTDIDWHEDLFINLNTADTKKTYGFMAIYSNKDLKARYGSGMDMCKTKYFRHYTDEDFKIWPKDRKKYYWPELLHNYNIMMIQEDIEFALEQYKTFHSQNTGGRPFFHPEGGVRKRFIEKEFDLTPEQQKAYDEAIARNEQWNEDYAKRRDERHDRLMAKYRDVNGLIPKRRRIGGIYE